MIHKKNILAAVLTGLMLAAAPVLAQDATTAAAAPAAPAAPGTAANAAAPATPVAASASSDNASTASGGGEATLPVNLGEPDIELSSPGRFSGIFRPATTRTSCVVASRCSVRSARAATRRTC